MADVLKAKNCGTFVILKQFFRKNRSKRYNNRRSEINNPTLETNRDINTVIENVSSDEEMVDIETTEELVSHPTQRSIR